VRICRATESGQLDNHNEQACPHRQQIGTSVPGQGSSDEGAGVLPSLFTVPIRVITGLVVVGDR
jgi:hypothetical protein